MQQLYDPRKAVATTALDSSVYNKIHKVTKYRVAKLAHTREVKLVTFGCPEVERCEHPHSTSVPLETTLGKYYRYLRSKEQNIN